MQEMQVQERLQESCYHSQESADQVHMQVTFLVSKGSPKRYKCINVEEMHMHAFKYTYTHTL